MSLAMYYGEDGLAHIFTIERSMEIVEPLEALSHCLSVAFHRGSTEVCVLMRDASRIMLPYFDA